MAWARVSAVVAVVAWRYRAVAAVLGWPAACKQPGVAGGEAALVPGCTGGDAPDSPRRRIGKPAYTWPLTSLVAAELARVWK